jgi:hypothetical protein
METIFTKIFIVFVEVGVSVHGRTGEKQIITEEGNLPDFSPTLLRNVRVNCPKIVVGGGGERGRRKNFSFYVKIPRYFYTIILFSTTILHMPSF